LPDRDPPAAHHLMQAGPSEQPLGELRARFRQEAGAAGVNPRDVDLLIATILGRSPSWLFAHPEYRLSQPERERVEAAVERRLAGEPVQYIRGSCEFYGREFLVDSRVLIPRPETEHLVEEALRRLPGAAAVLDVCAGSGCVGVTLALERPRWQVTLSDLSTAALAVARGNATRHAADVGLVAADLLAPLTGRFEAIVSNPPYIPRHEWEALATEVRDHEPALALTPGESGLEVIDRLLEEAPQRLVAGGLLLFEIGFGQAEAVRTRCSSGWELLELVNDLAGIPRVAVLKSRALNR
jgi:release factor glutamine methyltransferase